jgi:hypothetical protein
MATNELNPTGQVFEAYFKQAWDYMKNQNFEKVSDQLFT